MSLLDLLSGGKSNAAQNALEEARKEYEGINVPSLSELSLPELQKYVNAGLLTPAQAQTALIQGNAYNDIKLSPETTEAQQSALNELKKVATEGGMTDEMKAQLTEALDKVATQERGANASILDQMAQRGIPTSLMGTAAQLANAGNESQSANLAATQAAGQAETNAINAMMNQGNLASTMQNQQYQQSADKAAAENAMRAWNAGATNTTNLTNAGYQQQANEYNTQNKQNVANQNTGLANYRTGYNVQVPETIFGNKMQKAAGMAGVDQAQANLAQSQGNQNAALNLGLLNLGTTAATGMMKPTGGFNPQNPTEAGFNNMYQTGGYAHGGMVETCMEEGGQVPGKASVPGDSPQNDKVHALLSPGEVVVPRSIVPNPEAVKRFVQSLAFQPKKSTAHPDDVHTVLQALTKMREGEMTNVPSSTGPITVRKGTYHPPTLMDFAKSPSVAKVVPGGI